MGCAKSAEAEPSLGKVVEDKPKTNQQPVSIKRYLPPERYESQSANVADTAQALNESARPTWNQPNQGHKNLNAPSRPQNIEVSPINIVFSSEQELLPNMKDIASLQSKKIISISPQKMSAIEENPQENAPSNEIRRVPPVAEEIEELHSINNKIKQNSHRLEGQVQEDEIVLHKVSELYEDSDRLGEEVALAPFGFHLPRVEIGPQLAQPV